MFLTLLKKISAASLLLLACQVLLLLAMQIVSQRLGNIGYGHYGWAMSISVGAAQFIQWGMDQLLTAKFARGSAEESQRLTGLLLRQKQFAALAVVIVAGIVAYFWNDATERPLLFLGAVDGIFLAFTIPSVFDARGQSATWQFFAFLRHAAYLGAILCLVVFFPLYSSPLVIVALHGLCIVPQVLLEQNWINRNYGLPHWPAPARDALILWRDATPMALAMLAQQTLYFGGIQALHAFGKKSEMGALTLSNQLTVAATSFLAAAGSILHARLALHAHEGRAYRRRVWRTVAVCAIVGTAISLAFIVAGDWIIPLAFKNFARLTPPILAVDAWRLAPILASAPLASTLICLNRLRLFAACHVAALLSFVIASALLIPAHGARGAAGAVAIGCTAFFLCSTAAVFYAFAKSAPEAAK